MKHCGRVDPCLPLRIARTHPTSLQSLFQCRACNCTCDLTAAAHLRREPTADLETLLLSYLLTPANDEVPNPDAPDAASGAAVLLGCADRGCGASLDIPPPPARPRPE
jgi:hypothetical protein